MPEYSTTVRNFNVLPYDLISPVQFPAVSDSLNSNSWLLVLVENKEEVLKTSGNFEKKLIKREVDYLNAEKKVLEVGCANVKEAQQNGNGITASRGKNGELESVCVVRNGKVFSMAQRKGQKSKGFFEKHISELLNITITNQDRGELERAVENDNFGKIYKDDIMKICEQTVYSVQDLWSLVLKNKNENYIKKAFNGGEESMIDEFFEMINLPIFDDFNGSQELLDRLDVINKRVSIISEKIVENLPQNLKKGVKDLIEKNNSFASISSGRLSSNGGFEEESLERSKENVRKLSEKNNNILSALKSVNNESLNTGFLRDVIDFLTIYTPLGGVAPKIQALIR